MRVLVASREKWASLARDKSLDQNPNNFPSIPYSSALLTFSEDPLRTNKTTAQTDNLTIQFNTYWDNI